MRGGDGGSIDYTKAFEHYQCAANMGHVDARFHLGQMYDLGRGTLMNSTNAFSCYSKAADQGHQEAQFFLGLSYENRATNAELDDTKKALFIEAISLYQKAAAQGHREAQFQLGYLL